MRKIGLGAAAFLVFVAVASGATNITSQKALRAPHPSGATKKGGLVGQVACASSSNCAAIGEWLYSELSGKWAAAVTPTAPQTGGTTLRSLDCPAAGKCVAVGRGGLQHVVAVTQNGRKWTAAALALPADAAPLGQPGGPSPSLDSVSCSSPGNCLAVGRYRGTDKTIHPLLVSETNGTWSAGADGDALLPANAATTPDPNQPDTGATLSFVSCPAAGDCTAVGSYSNADAGDSDYAWVVSETDGVWAPGTEVLLPANAATYGDSSVGASPFFGFTGLSCPSAGNCTAVGGYEDTNRGEEGLILAERNGSWSAGIKAPLPSKGVPHSEPNAFTIPLTSVSCSAPGNCSAVGLYVTSRSGSYHGLLLREQSGEWKASALVLPAKAKAPGGVFLTSVACPSGGSCVAAGYYADQGKTHGLIVRERGGKWQRAVNAALPQGAAPASRSHTSLNSVTCPSAGACTAGGYYADRSGRTQGLLLSLRLR